MFGNGRRQPRHQGLDLPTVRDTVGYMHDDVVRTPGCERLAIAFGAVLREIDALERQRITASGNIVAARFVPFRRRRDEPDRQP